MSKAGIIIGVLVALLILERVFPAVTLRENFARLGRNFSLSFLNAALGPIIVVPITLYASRWQLHWYSHYLIVDLLLLDCWIYFWHRLNHRIPFLWRFHEVHHLDETLDATSALRFHFGEVALSSIVRAFVIFSLGVPFATVAIFEILLTVAALFHHSNLRLPEWFEKPLSFVIVTPSIHFVHHHALQSDTDSNYATVLSVWDRLFRSRSSTQRSLEMKMGVENLSDVPLLRLIMRPFYKV